jgi:molybdenum cofactor biosynthesis enzyme MoaA
MSSSILSRVPGALRQTLETGRLPLGVSWVVTNRCNLHCVYCDCPDVVVQELSPDEALDVIDEMADLGTARVHLTGGEPFMRRDLDALISRLRYHDMRVSLSSNGTLIPKRRRLLRGLRSVSLSLDGPPEIHDSHRAQGQVEQVKAALAVLREEGVTRYLTCLIASDTTPACFDFVLAVAREYGAEVYFQPALDIVLASERPSPVVASAPTVAAHFADLIARKARGEPVGNSVAGLRHLSTWPTPKPLPCVVNRLAVRLTPDGILLPCHERAAAPDGESVRDGGFGAAFRRLRLKRCTECWGAGRVDMREAIRRGPFGLGELVGS